MIKLLWALMSYPLSLLVIFMPAVFPLEGMDSFLYVSVIFLVWIILAVWFGISYFKHAYLKNVLGLLILMLVHILSVVMMFAVIAIPWVSQETLMGANDRESFTNVLVLGLPASCFILFSIIGFAYNAFQQTDNADGEEPPSVDETQRPVEAI